jgi:endonuclease/exonuclease/phosphatase family metal-dependent hydrolase
MQVRGWAGDYNRGEMGNTVGLFFRRDVFELVGGGRMRFCAFSEDVAFPSYKGAVLAALRHRATGRDVLVAAVHLSVPLGATGRPDTRKPIAELKQLRGKIEDIFVRNYDAAGRQRPPLVLAGDFNCLPYRHGSDMHVAPPDVYELLTAPTVAGGWGLTSAYAAVRGCEPAFTSVCPRFPHCIDYIFSNHGAAASRVLDITELGGNLGTLEALAASSRPCPSDHLPLVAEVVLLPAPPRGDDRTGELGGLEGSTRAY